MSSPLHLAIPLSGGAPSCWRSAHGFWFRIHARPVVRQSALLATLKVKRHSQRAAVCLRLRLSTAPSPAYARPVQNVHAPSRPDRHPQVVTLRLRQDTHSASVTFPPLVASRGARTLVVLLHVDVDPISSAGLGDCRRTQLLSSSTTRVLPLPASASRGSLNSLPDTASERTVQWLDKPHPAERRGSTGAAYVPDEAVAKPVIPLRGRHAAGYDDEDTNVEYNLSSLLSSASGSVASDFSDVAVLVGAAPDPVVFNLHRCVLALASPVLRAMLSSDMVERQTGRVELPNFSPDAVSLAVLHIYGEDVSKRFKPENLFELYRFAHQFEMSSLLTFSRRRLLDNVTVDTAVPVVCFALVYDDAELRKHSHEFIAHHFSEMTSSSHTLDVLCSLPKPVMYDLLESDSVRATELEVLMLSLRWLARQGGSSSADDLLGRIRWGLMTSDMLHVVQSAGITMLSPNAEQGIFESRISLVDEGEASMPVSISRRRFFGRPTASLWVPLIQKPPAAFLPVKEQKRRRRRSMSHFGVEPHVDTSFERFGLQWNFRAQATPCEDTGCGCARVSASLWLEEGEDGRIWRREGDRGEVMPLRVVARCLVWNGKGGRVWSKMLIVVFRSAGWACGWSVQDLVDGREEGGGREKFMEDALQVAVEICECTSLR